MFFCKEIRSRYRFLAASAAAFPPPFKAGTTAETVEGRFSREGGDNDRLFPIVAPTPALPLVHKAVAVLVLADEDASVRLLLELFLLLLPLSPPPLLMSLALSFLSFLSVEPSYKIPYFWFIFKIKLFLF